MTILQPGNVGAAPGSPSDEPGGRLRFAVPVSADGNGSGEGVCQREESLTLSEASLWAARHTGRKVTASNISYLIRYDRIAATVVDGELRVPVSELARYYRKSAGRSEESYKRQLGDDLNWRLSFEQYKESETTKHVHRLHPYKGKFIPQLVEYFLDANTDEFKEAACFTAGDLILDPFCGSGTTLVQANELGLHAVGVDVSRFNAMISNLKLSRLSLLDLAQVANHASRHIAANETGQRARDFEEELLAELKAFNAEHFPSPEFRRSVKSGAIDEDRYGSEQAEAFKPRYYRLLQKHCINNEIVDGSGRFMDSWYLKSVRSEVCSALSFIDGIADAAVQNVLRLILSRTVRSSRATTHSDLATLIKPVTETYYCGKHSKICKPLFSMLGWWRRYSEDTVKRKAQFDKIRTETMQVCLTGDSRAIDLPSALAAENPELAALVRQNGIQGIFSSPPYVGLIDYHEQHAYAYELFNLPRNDAWEIGPMKSGSGRQARRNYANGIAQTLANCLKFMTDDCHIFLVANDRFGLYPGIAEQAGLLIHQEYKRPVLNRSEGDKGAYAETIFHLRRR